MTAHGPPRSGWTVSTGAYLIPCERLHVSTVSPALEDIAFLANSENRVAVLESLCDGAHARHVLMEQTDVSRVTLGRILEELEQRRWITRNGQICDITPLGAWVCEEFLAFEGTMEAENELRAVSQWLPDTGYDFHISHLAQGEITLVTRADATAPISRLIQHFDVGGPMRAFSFAITASFLQACHRHVLDENITWEWVFTPDVRRVLEDDADMRRYSREMLTSGGARYREFDGEIPHVVIISTELVNLRLADADGAATALIQVNHPEVREWAERTFETYWDAATPVSVDAFTP